MSYVTSSTQGFLIPCRMPDWRRWRLQRSSAAFSHCEVVDLSLVYIRQWCNILQCPSYIQTSWKSCIGTGTAAYCQPSPESWVAGIHTLGDYAVGIHADWSHKCWKKNVLALYFFFKFWLPGFFGHFHGINPAWSKDVLKHRGNSSPG